MATEEKRRGSLILRIALLCFSVFMIISLSSRIKEYSSLKSELNDNTKRRDELSAKVKEQMNLLENGNDSDFIEKAAREKLDFVYPNEHKYIDISGE